MSNAAIIWAAISGAFGILSTAVIALLLYNAKAIVSQLKTLGEQALSLERALANHAHEVSKLTDQVKQLDHENTTLRKAHDALTTWMIGKGILPAPPPPPATVGL